MTANLNLWLIPVLPLAGTAINGFLGKKSSRTAVSAVGLFFSGAAFLWALKVAWQASSIDLPYQEFLAHWIRSGAFSDYGHGGDVRGFSSRGSASFGGGGGPRGGGGGHR